MYFTLQQHYHLLLEKFIQDQPTMMISQDGDEIAVPDEIVMLLKEILYHLSKGKKVLIVPEADWITLSEAAELLHVSRTTVEKWVKQGKIESMALPFGTKKKMRFKLQDVLYLKILQQTK